jgi:hypothetical protein
VAPNHGRIEEKELHLMKQGNIGRIEEKELYSMKQGNIVPLQPRIGVYCYGVFFLQHRTGVNSFRVANSAKSMNETIRRMITE